MRGGSSRIALEEKSSCGRSRAVRCFTTFGDYSSVRAGMWTVVLNLVSPRACLESDAHRPRCARRWAHPCLLSTGLHGPSALYAGRTPVWSCD